MADSGHPNLVVLQVPDEAALVTLLDRLAAAGVPCVGWREEDLGGSLTAVGTAAVSGAMRKPFARLKLLGAAA